MNQDDSNLSLINAKLNIKLGEILLSNSRENLSIHQLNIKYFQNQYKLIKEEEYIENFTLQQKQLLAEFTEKVKKENYESIQNLQKESNKRRIKIIDEINKAKERIEKYRESIESSKQVISEPIPYFDSSLIMNAEVFQTKIQTAQQAIENLRAKKPRWEKIREEYKKYVKEKDSKPAIKKESESKFTSLISLKDIQKTLKEN